MVALRRYDNYAFRKLIVARPRNYQYKHLVVLASTRLTKSCAEDLWSYWQKNNRISITLTVD